jgi:hypothetical protein
VPDAPDPLGKRALFWLPVDAEAGVTPEPLSTGVRRVESAPDRTRRHVRPAGKRALYSSTTPAEEPDRETSSATATDPVPRRGRLSVACSSCGAVTRVGLLGFLVLQLSFGVWLPGREFDRWMTCPACHRRAWTSVTCTR